MSERGPIGRILETALAAGLVGGIGGLPAGPIGAGVGAAGGALAGAAAGAYREAFPTSEERLEPAELAATHESASKVPALVQRVVGIEQRVVGLETFAFQVVDELGHQRAARTRERIAQVGLTLLRLVADGHAQVDAFDGEQRESVVEAVRFSLDALRPEAVPMIARLCARPVDHFFRGVCRVLVDLSADELVQIAALIAGAAQALPSYLTRAERMKPDDPQLEWTQAHQAEVTDLDLERDSLAGTSDTVLRWVFVGCDAPESIRVARESALVALLVAHRVAEPPANFSSHVGGDLEGGGFHIDKRALTMTIDRLLDLHFVMTGERITDPRARADG